MNREMTIRDALENALTFLKSLGYTRWPIQEDLELAIRRLDDIDQVTRRPATISEKLVKVEAAK